jgi:hypothetical protein
VCGCLISQIAADAAKKKNSFRAVKKSKNRLRFFDFLPLFKILFAAAGGDLSYETASFGVGFSIFLPKTLPAK